MVVLFNWENRGTMAEKSAKKRQLKKVETVRQRAERSDLPKKRHVKATAGKAGRPFKAVGRAIARISKPFAFVVKPFKTRPLRFVGRILMAVLGLRYIRNAWTEVRQVQWPSARETYRMTVAVFVFSVVFGAIVAVTDYGLDKVFRKVFID
jgi:preprotein translocase SecE subunit